jgi:transcriptional regulator with XRE-family HTH domain
MHRLCKRCRRLCVSVSTLKSVTSALLKALGRRIRKLRLAAGYSQETFADQCGVHRTFMGTLERGESNVSFANLVKVAETLGITLSELVAGIEDDARKKGIKGS